METPPPLTERPPSPREKYLAAIEKKARNESQITVVPSKRLKGAKMDWSNLRKSGWTKYIDEHETEGLNNSSKAKYATVYFSPKKKFRTYRNPMEEPYLIDMGLEANSVGGAENIVSSNELNSASYTKLNGGSSLKRKSRKAHRKYRNAKSRRHRKA